MKDPNTLKRKSKIQHDLPHLTSIPSHSSFLRSIPHFSPALFSSYLHCHRSSVPYHVPDSLLFFFFLFLSWYFHFPTAFPPPTARVIVFPVLKALLISPCSSSNCYIFFPPFICKLTWIISGHTFQFHPWLSKLASSPCIHLQPHLTWSLTMSSNQNFREKYSILRYARHFCQRQP